MTAEELFNAMSNGGVSDFAHVVAICRAVGSFCLVGDFAVNCYVEPIFTLNVEFVLVIGEIDQARRRPAHDQLAARLNREGFEVRESPSLVSAQAAISDLHVQITTDARYKKFPERAQEKTVLGVGLPVAAMDDIVRGKLWSYSDPQRRLSKRKKDELDLLRLAEQHPQLIELYPAELRRQLEQR